MRAFACALGISLAVAGDSAAAAPALPRTASLNLCTDELLLLLGRPDQIASVTHLSRLQAETPLWQQARRYPRNDGSLLSVVGQRPDLVLTMGGAGRDRLRIAERLGIQTLDLPYAMSLADVGANIGRVAAAMGRPAEGARMLRRMAALVRQRPAAPTDAIWLGGGGRTAAPSGLTAQWMRLAGFAQRAIPGDRVSLETLLTRPPAILLRSDYRQGQFSGQQRWLGHPLARRPINSRTVVTDGRRWTCLGPMMIDEIARLRRLAA